MEGGFEDQDVVDDVPSHHIGVFGPCLRCLGFGHLFDQLVAHGKPIVQYDDDLKEWSVLGQPSKCFLPFIGIFGSFCVLYAGHSPSIVVAYHDNKSWTSGEQSQKHVESSQPGIGQLYPKDAQYTQTLLHWLTVVAFLGGIYWFMRFGDYRKSHTAVVTAAETAVKINFGALFYWFGTLVDFFVHFSMDAEFDTEQMVVKCDSDRNLKCQVGSGIVVGGLAFVITLYFNCAAWASLPSLK